MLSREFLYADIELRDRICLRENCYCWKQIYLRPCSEQGRHGPDCHEFVPYLRLMLNHGGKKFTDHLIVSEFEVIEDVHDWWKDCWIAGVSKVYAPGTHQSLLKTIGPSAYGWWILEDSAGVLWEERVDLLYDPVKAGLYDIAIAEGQAFGNESAYAIEIAEVD